MKQLITLEQYAELPESQRDIILSLSGKCPGIWADFALKHEHLPPIMSSNDLSFGSTAPEADPGTRHL
jgi:hypothetical protein